MVTVSNPYPNPVGMGGTVKFNLLSSCPQTVDWGVYTITSRMIYGETAEVNGPKTAVWDLKDQKGVAVGIGIYYVKVKVPGGNPAVLKVLVGN
jgi:hypothetical protein